MPDARSPVHPHGPVFISYRQSDGTKPVTRLSWLLRAAGVPVWHDVTDLPPGDTKERLAHALASGLSGGVLVVSEEIQRSDVVRNSELPALLALEKNPDFVLAVGTTIRLPSGSLDYGAADRLLGQPDGTIRRLKQHGADSRTDLVQIAREILVYRCARLAVTRSPDDPAVLHISVQSRSAPHANDQDTADLSIRLRPATTGRLPSPKGLKDLKATLPLLPEALAVSGAQSVRITGGAHLTVAFALGCALPTTLIGAVTVEATDGQEWRTGTVSAPVGDDPGTRIAGHGSNGIADTGSAKTVLAYVDLLPDPSNAAYTRLLSDNADQFDAWIHIRTAQDGLLVPADADRVVTEVAGRLRKLSQDHDNADLHIALRVPFPVAVLLGRLLNTQHMTVYEWTPDHNEDDPDHRPRFVPALTVRPTDAAGPISAVLLSKP